MSSKRHSQQGSEPTGTDVLQALEWIGKDLDGSVRFIVTLGTGKWEVVTLCVTLQLYRIIEGKAWILGERKFYWPNNEGRKFDATVLLELHRAYHKWGDLVY
jgi:hypothetical protein